MRDLKQKVANRARWLDGIKPGWEKLVPLEEGKLDMWSGCAPCVADYIFAEEACSIKHMAGFRWVRDALLDGISPQEFCGGGDDLVSMWREEISARLARWTPSDVSRGISSEVAVQATVDA